MTTGAWSSRAIAVEVVVGDLLHHLLRERLGVLAGLGDGVGVVGPAGREGDEPVVLEEVAPGLPAAREQPQAVHEHDRGELRRVRPLDLGAFPVGQDRSCLFAHRWILSTSARPSRPRLRLCPTTADDQTPRGLLRAVHVGGIRPSFGGDPADSCAPRNGSASLSTDSGKGFHRPHTARQDAAYALERGALFRAPGSSPGAFGGRSMIGMTTRARRRVVATIPVLAFAAAGLATMGATTGSTAPSHVSAPVIGDDEYYMNYVAPRAEDAFGSDEEVTAGDRRPQRRGRERGDREGRRARPQVQPGQPGRRSRAREARGEGDRDRQEPEDAEERAKGHAGGEAPHDPRRVRRERERRLHRVVRADRVRLDRVQAGRGAERPAPQQHPRTRPSYDLEDNNSMWVPDFSSEHFNKMLFTDEGITERVRTDLTGPDGKPGFDISGYTMKNMYEEMSRGAYTVHGSATPWVTVPHSEAYYGASLCFKDEEGVYKAGAIQDMQGHPDNPLGPGQLPDRRGRGARTGAARLPLGRLRHRGPGRPRRRRQRARARRRDRPRRARARRRGQVRRRRRRGHVRDLGALLGGRRRR